MIATKNSKQDIDLIIEQEKDPRKVNFILYELNMMLKYTKDNFGLKDEIESQSFLSLIKDLISEFSIEEIIDKIQEFINAYTKHLESDLKKSLDIDIDVVVRFKQIFEEKYFESPMLRNIIGNTKPTLLENSNKGNFFGINLLLDRSMFIKNWHATYYGLENYGIQFSEVENTFIGKELFNSSTQYEISKQNLLDELNNYVKDDHILIGFNFYFYYEIFRDDVYNSFKPKGRTEDNIIESGNLKKGFQGVYKEKNEVYTVRDSTQEKRILIIKKRHLDFLKQINPISEDQDTPIPKLELVANHVGFNILDYADKNNEELIKYQLDQNPNWLSEFKSKEEKTNYLKTKVWFRALQKFKVEIPSDFDAITIIVKN